MRANAYKCIIIPGWFNRVMQPQRVFSRGEKISLLHAGLSKYQFNDFDEEVDEKKIRPTV